MPPTLRNSRKTSNTTDKRKACQWTGEETRKLIAKIQRQLKIRDPLPYMKRINALNWNEIAFPPRSITECKIHFDAVIKKTRRTRTLGEILTDVEVDVEPANDTKDGILPVNSSKRKTKRLSTNNQHYLNEATPERPFISPFQQFAKYEMVRGRGKVFPSSGQVLKLKESRKAANHFDVKVEMEAEQIRSPADTQQIPLEAELPCRMDEDEIDGQEEPNQPKTVSRIKKFFGRIGNWISRN